MLESGFERVLTDCSAVFAVSCSLCQAHGVLTDLCSFSLSKLSQAGHCSTTQQQMRTAQVHLLEPSAQQEINIKTDTNSNYHIHTLKVFMSYTETRHQAGQVNVSWSKHMQLLQT